MTMVFGRCVNTNVRVMPAGGVYALQAEKTSQRRD
jgi:hypothetical protein